MVTKKGRDQSTIDFLDSLQTEYVIFELRRKIYKKQKDKDFCDKSLKYKESAIKEISLRNPNLKTIFNDEPTKQALYSKIYGTKGYPRFDLIDYRSNERMQEFCSKDKSNYYSEGSVVLVEVEEKQFKVGSLIKVFLTQGTCRVKLKGESEDRVSSLNCITRIL